MKGSPRNQLSRHCRPLEIGAQRQRPSQCRPLNRTKGAGDRELATLGIGLPRSLELRQGDERTGVPHDAELVDAGWRRRLRPADATPPATGKIARKSPPETWRAVYEGVGLAGLERDFGLDLFLGLGRGRRRYRLHTHLELDLVPQDEAAGFQRLVPGQVVVLAVQLGLRVEAHPAVAPWVLALVV